MVECNCQTQMQQMTMNKELVNNGLTNFPKATISIVPIKEFE